MLEEAGVEQIEQSLQWLKSKLRPDRSGIDRFEQLQLTIAIIEYECKVRLDYSAYAAALELVRGTIEDKDEVPYEFKKQYGIENHSSNAELLSIELEKLESNVHSGLVEKIMIKVLNYL